MAFNKTRLFQLDYGWCYKAITGVNNGDSKARFAGPNGKWAMFNSSGWISDLTDQAEITITMPQSMLVSIHFISINLKTACFILVYLLCYHSPIESHLHTLTNSLQNKTETNHTLCLFKQ